MSHDTRRRHRLIRAAAVEPTDKMTPERMTKKPARALRSKGAASRPAAVRRPKRRPVRPLPDRGPAFPIVGIGASAGGLDALKRLLGAMPADSGMAFVLIPHLDPTHESLMAELLAKQTAMPVQRGA